MAAKLLWAKNTRRTAGELTSRFATKHFATNRFTEYRLSSFAVDSLRISLQKTNKKLWF